MDTSAKAYIYQLRADSEYHLETLPRGMDDTDYLERETETETESKEFIHSALF